MENELSGKPRLWSVFVALQGGDYWAYEDCTAVTFVDDPDSLSVHQKNGGHTTFRWEGILYYSVTPVKEEP